ncbi:MAG TPA: sugar phosphate nucleotidyltransferase, partial [Candidatus Krumholzibacterium sp.]|nr:sugar phosphate nucleotidyltransferase [Candidatus Krumholzibacterium sp.]
MKTAGMILAAGLGTRMGAISGFLPKPLLPVTGVPMISVIASKLSRSGANSLHANVHHRPELIERYIERSGLQLVLHHEVELLDTGGGIGNMAGDGIDADIVLLHNGDIISGLEYGPAIEYHVGSGALFTMILLPSTGCSDGFAPPPHVLVDGDGSVTGFDPSGYGAPPGPGSGRFGYTGMSVISRECLERFPSGEKYGLTAFLGELSAELPGSVKGYLPWTSAPAGERGPHPWADTGDPSAYLMLHQRIMAWRELFDPLLQPPPDPVILGKGSIVDPGVSWKGFLCVGQNAVIKEDTVL